MNRQIAIAQCTAQEIKDEAERRAHTTAEDAREWVTEYLAEAEARGGLSGVDGNENGCFFPDSGAWGFDPDKALLIIAGTYNENGGNHRKASLYVMLKRHVIVWGEASKEPLSGLPKVSKLHLTCLAQWVEYKP